MAKTGKKKNKKIVLAILGGLCIISGLGGNAEVEAGARLICIIIGAALFYLGLRKGKNGTSKKMNTSATNSGFQQMVPPAKQPPEYVRQSNTKRDTMFRRLSVDLDIDEILKTDDYVVLDTETTGLDAYRDKIVQIAMVSVVDGKVVETFSSFINPKCHMPEAASRINHITDADLVGAPSSADISDAVLAKINGKTVIAHNADFDMNFLKQWFLNYTGPINVKYIDTLALSRKAFPNVGKYSLQHLIEILEIESSEAHRADADALATQQLFELCKAQTPKLSKIESYENDLRVRHTQIKPTVDHFDEQHPLYQKKIAFTGAMEMSREEAMQKAVNCGALLRNSISRRTDYLVCGELLQTASGVAAYSGKKEEAEQLNQAGEGHIKIITEQDFYDLLEAKD